jgi:hypothetical protein
LLGRCWRRRADGETSRGNRYARIVAVAVERQRWYWTREQYAVLWGDEEGPLGPIVKDLGSAVAAVWAVYEATLQDAFVMEWTLEQTTMELSERLAVVSLG